MYLSHHTSEFLAGGSGGTEGLLLGSLANLPQA